MKRQQYVDVVARDYMKIKAGKFDVDFSRNLGNIRLIDDTLRVKKNITGKGGANTTVPLLDISESRLEGVRDFDRAALPKGVYAVVKRIRVGYASHATETDPAKVKYSSLVDDGTTVADQALLNARIEIRQNNEIVAKLPVSDCMNEALDHSPIGDMGYELENKYMLLPDVPVEINLVFGSAIGTAAQHFIEVALKVSKTLEK